MERYVLTHFYEDAGALYDALDNAMTDNPIIMGIDYSDVLEFVAYCVFGYFYNDYVVYDDAEEFENRLAYDIALKLPYWYKKYNYVKKLLTTEDFSLLQTSKMTSSSSDLTKSAGGSLQKGATTPTGVSTGTTTDAIDITIGSDTTDGDNDITTDGFVDKYTNHQQKYANASRIEGEREGTILREGSINELVDVLEKLPSSFADEITRQVQKHFIFDYDGIENELY